MMRVGQVIGMVPEKIEEYKRLHSDGSAESAIIRPILRAHNFHNFNIYITKLDDGKDYLFAFYEYTGDDYEKDNADLMSIPEYHHWLSMTDPCQKPLAGYESWKHMEQVYYEP